MVWVSCSFLYWKNAACFAGSNTIDDNVTKNANVMYSMLFRSPSLLNSIGWPFFVVSWNVWVFMIWSNVVLWNEFRFEYIACLIPKCSSHFWESHEIQSNYFYPISLFRTTIIIALFNWDIRRILRFECVRTFSSKNSLHSNMCLNSRTTAWNTRIELSFVSIFSHNSLHRSQYNFSVFSFIVIGIQLHYYPTC